MEEPRVLALSDSFLLVFEPEQKPSTAGDYSALTACIALNHIAKVKKNLKVPSILTINWKHKDSDVKASFLSQLLLDIRTEDKNRRRGHLLGRADQKSS